MIKGHRESARIFKKPEGHAMTSLTQRLNEESDEFETTQEQFLCWHYSHAGVYLKLKEIALKERKSGQTSIRMCSLFDLYEDSLVQDGRAEEIVPRHYARFYRSLLSSNPYLWAFLKMSTVPDTEISGG
jgi:hypothetical protein